MLVSWLCGSPFKSCKSRTQTEALNRSIRRNRKVRGKMHAFGNCTRGKHFIGGNNDLVYWVIPAQRDNLVFCGRGQWVFNLQRRGAPAPPTSPGLCTATRPDHTLR